MGRTGLVAGIGGGAVAGTGLVAGTGGRTRAGTGLAAGTGGGGVAGTGLMTCTGGDAMAGTGGGAMVGLCIAGEFLLGSTDVVTEYCGAQYPSLICGCGGD